MKKVIGIIILISFSTQPISIEFGDIKQQALENGKKIVMEHGEKIVGVLGIASAALFVGFFYRYKLMRAKLEDLHRIIMHKKALDIKEGLEGFLDGNNKIDIDLILMNKIHICWHKVEDYGSKELDKLHALLWICKRKYQCPINIETHYINEQLECVIIDKYNQK